MKNQPRDDKIDNTFINKHQNMPYSFQYTIQVHTIKDPQYKEKHFPQNEIQKIGGTVNHELSEKGESGGGGHTENDVL